MAGELAVPNSRTGFTTRGLWLPKVSIAGKGWTLWSQVYTVIASGLHIGESGRSTSQGGCTYYLHIHKERVYGIQTESQVRKQDLSAIDFHYNDATSLYKYLALLEVHRINDYDPHQYVVPACFAKA